MTTFNLIFRKNSNNSEPEPIYLGFEKSGSVEPVSKPSASHLIDDLPIAIVQSGFNQPDSENHTDNDFKVYHETYPGVDTLQEDKQDEKDSLSLVNSSLIKSGDISAINEETIKPKTGDCAPTAVQSDDIDKEYQVKIRSTELHSRSSHVNSVSNDYEPDGSNQEEFQPGPNQTRDTQLSDNENKLIVNNKPVTLEPGIKEWMSAMSKYYNLSKP